MGYAHLRDPNAEYTMRDLSAETMGLTESRGERQDVESTDVQTVIVDVINRRLTLTAGVELVR